MSTKFKSVALRAFATAAALTLALTGFAPAAHAATGSVAKVGDTEYASLQDAVNAAGGETVTLLDNADLEKTVTVTGNGAVIDLAGHTVTAESNSKAIVVDGGKLVLVDSTAQGMPVVSQDYETVTYASGKVVAKNIAVAVVRGGSFTLNSGAVESTGNTGVFAGATDGGAGSFVMNGGYVSAREYGIGVMNEGSSVEIAGGVVVANDNAALAGNGTQGLGGTSMTVSGGILISHIQTNGYIACGIYHPQSGKLNVTGGTIYADGGVGVLARAGSASITGGEIIATGSNGGWVGDRQFDVPSAGVVVDRAAGYPGVQGDDVVSISGNAVVTADKGQPALQVIVKEDAPKDDLIEVTGGSFSSPIEQEFLGEGFNPTRQPDGSYGVHKHSLVKVDAVAPTCDKDGLLLHWKCATCGDLFFDEAMTKPANDVVDPKFGHAAVKVPAKEATVDIEGNIEHWYCEACGTYFANAELTKKLTKDEVVLPKLPHEFTVTFDDGVNAPYTVKVKKGELLAEPKAPALEGWEFKGWFKVKNPDGSVTDKWKFNEDVVSADMTLYGGWTKLDAAAEKPKGELPKTGDDSMLPIVLAGTVGVAAVATGIVLSRKKK